MYSHWGGLNSPQNHLRTPLIPTTTTNVLLLPRVAVIDKTKHGLITVLLAYIILCLTDFSSGIFCSCPCFAALLFRGNLAFISSFCIKYVSV